jgi:hypothetical protein
MLMLKFVHVGMGYEQIEKISLFATRISSIPPPLPANKSQAFASHLKRRKTKRKGREVATIAVLADW